MEKSPETIQIVDAVIHANLAIRVTALSVLLVTRCISQNLGGYVAFI